MRAPRAPRKALLVLAVVLVGTAAGVALQTATTEGDTLFSWKRPDYLGVRDGKLARCKRTPNCVSSQADPSDTEHYIAPIAVHGDAQEVIAEARAAVESMDGARVIREMPGYLYAEFRTRLMRFVDDVEFSLDEKAQLLHVRSASRLGRRDFGVNRERVEAIRSLLLRRSHARAGGGSAAP